MDNNIDDFDIELEKDLEDTDDLFNDVKDKIENKKQDSQDGEVLENADTNDSMPKTKLTIKKGGLIVGVIGGILIVLCIIVMSIKGTLTNAKNKENSETTKTKEEVKTTDIVTNEDGFKVAQEKNVGNTEPGQAVNKDDTNNQFNTNETTLGKDGNSNEQANLGDPNKPLDVKDFDNNNNTNVNNNGNMNNPNNNGNNNVNANNNAQNTTSESKPEKPKREKVVYKLVKRGLTIFAGDSSKKDNVNNNSNTETVAKENTSKPTTKPTTTNNVIAKVDNKNDNAKQISNKNDNILTGSFKNTLLEGSYIPIAISTTINTDEPGMFQAIVRENVYDSLTHRNVLLPIGTRLLGVYDKLHSNSDTKVNMRVHRMLLPNGKTVKLSNYQVTDLQGKNGGSGYYDGHYGKRLLNSGLALAVGLAKDFFANSSIGIKGFSLGRSNYDWNFKEIPLPKDLVEQLHGQYMNGKKNVVPENKAQSVVRRIRENNNLDPAYRQAVLESLKVYLDQHKGEPIDRATAEYLGGLLGQRLYEISTGSQIKPLAKADNSVDSNTTVVVNDLLDKGLLDSNGRVNSGFLDYLKYKAQYEMDLVRSRLGTNNIIKNVTTTYESVRNAWNSVTPTIHIEPGTRLNLYVGQDLILEPYKSNAR